MSSIYSSKVPIHEVSIQVQETLSFCDYFKKYHENSDAFRDYGCLILKIEGYGFYYPNADTMGHKGNVESQRLESVEESGVDPQYVMQHITAKKVKRSANDILKGSSTLKGHISTSSPLKPGYESKYMNVEVFPNEVSDPRMMNWSCAHIRNQEGNFLKFLDTKNRGKSDYVGITTALLYCSVGNGVSKQPIHIEDNFLHSINILHFGRGKSWYVIPSKESEKLEQKLDLYLGWSKKRTFEFLRHKSLFVTESFLNAVTSKDPRDIPIGYFHFRQKPGKKILYIYIYIYIYTTRGGVWLEG